MNKGYFPPNSRVTVHRKDSFMSDDFPDAHKWKIDDQGILYIYDVEDVLIASYYEWGRLDPLYFGPKAKEQVEAWMTYRKLLDTEE